MKELHEEEIKKLDIVLEGLRQEWMGLSSAVEKVRVMSNIDALLDVRLSFMRLRNKVYGR